MTKRASYRVIQFGLGAIGRETARLVKTKASLRLVGAVEADKGNRCATSLGVPVHTSLQSLLRQVGADVILHTTGSRLAAIEPQLADIARAGLHCISSAEELFFPIGRNAAIARRLDRLAIQHGTVILGTGVNPGFDMDLLPVLLSSTCQRIDRIVIRRIVDVSKRRIQLQRKVGVGLRRTEFRELMKAGRMGHVGLRESALFVASAIGWKLDSLSEITNPAVKDGEVAGIHQVVRGRKNGRAALTLELQMIVGAENPRDEVRIDGIMPLHAVIPGGVRGDQATAAILVNAIPLVFSAKPGLRSALELGLPRFLP